MLENNTQNRLKQSKQRKNNYKQARILQETPTFCLELKSKNTQFFKIDKVSIGSIGSVYCSLNILATYCWVLGTKETLIHSNFVHCPRSA